jgi:hypothetical protein
MRPGEMALNEAKKASLLASLSAMDEDDEGGGGRLPRKDSLGYSPSFGPAPKQARTIMQYTEEMSYRADHLVHFIVN